MVSSTGTDEVCSTGDSAVDEVTGLPTEVGAWTWPSGIWETTPPSREAEAAPMRTAEATTE